MFSFHRILSAGAACALLAVTPLLAGGTPTPPPNELFTQMGSGTPLANGNYVSNAAAPGLNSPLRYFVVVPPGTAQLVVEIFDADINAGGGAAAHELDIAPAGFNTSVQYTLFNPAGGVAGGPATLGPGACGVCNNAWAGFPIIANPAPGHWLVTVDMSAAVTAGVDVNGYGVRAHDGVAGAGGTELDVYAESFIALGTIGNPTTRTTNLFPYVTSGCVFDANSFDGDAQAGTQVAFTSRSGAFGQTVGTSGATTWLNSVVTGWRTDNAAVDYGAWSAAATTTTVAGGGLAGNIVTYYNGAFNAANPPTGGGGGPPTAQPEANSLRIYLPRDGGGSPALPYTEQLLTHVSGPNPPIAGMVSRVRVTVRLVNPAAQAITFAAPARVVTANVPGGGAVYGGGAVVSQGTVTAQPAVGGTGNVVWNPGTLAAGATALLGYWVDVTPPAAGSRVPVTGTPTLNGTTAVYRDTTANATQARATFTFGPLCELAVTEGMSTHAPIASFSATRVDEGQGIEAGVVVEWKTASEAGTVGFELFRHSASGAAIPVDGGRVVGLLDAPQGGTYRVLDSEADRHERLFYSLRELEASGRERLHGPFAVRPAAEAEAPQGGWERRARPAPEPSEAAKSPTPRNVAAGVARGATRLKLLVEADGLYRVEAASIAEVLGLASADVRGLIAGHRFALERAGEPVAYTALAGGDALLFFGEGVESPFSRHAVYRLALGEGLAMGKRAAPPKGTAKPTPFETKVDFENDLFAATAFGPDPRSDYWYWDTVAAGHPTFGTRTFELTIDGLDEGGGKARLTLELQSGLTTGVADEHRARVELGNAVLGEAVWDGVAAHVAEFEVDASALAGVNEVRVTGLLGPGVPYSGFFVDSFALTYPRRPTAHDDHLEMRFDAARTAVVDGFASPGIAVFDLGDPARPRWLSGTTIEPAPTAGPVGGGGFRVRFDAAAGGRYLVASPAAWRTPELVADLPSRLLAAAGAEYLIVTSKELGGEAWRLADHRTTQGLSAQVVLLEDIYDELNHGLPDPDALRRLLRHALEAWPVAPRYVVFAGAGSLDYRDLLGYGTPPVPPMMATSADGLYAADAAFVDGDGDGVADIAFGRIPAADATALAGYIDKVIAYEAGDEAVWENRLLLVADSVDEGADFAAASAALAETLPAGYAASIVDLGSESGRDELLGAFAEGRALIGYLGHGGIDRLSASAALHNDDVAGLENGERLPVLSALTCTVNRFEIPGFPALGALLVNQPDGGAAAVVSTAGLSRHGAATELAELLVRRLAERPGERLGDAFLAAARAFADRGGDLETLRFYNLLGDPALVPRLRPTPPSGEASGDS